MAASTDADRELHRLVQDLFTPREHVVAACAPWVGLEVELLVLDLDAPLRAPVPVADIRSALSAHPETLHGARLTFEPGGQLELSLPPQPTVAALTARADAVLARVTEALRGRRLRIATHGLDPRLTEAELVIQEPNDRYEVMQRHFDAIGTAGRRMMVQTAALQVCLDLDPVETGRQWLASNVVGPALAALFRNPPGSDNRTGVWLAADPSRTGFDGRQVDPDQPVDAYVRFALGAAAMPLPRAGSSAQVPDGGTLDDWIAEGHGRPDPADLRHHLSTLFPPVRPRGYLEVRYLDTQPTADLASAVLIVSILLGDPQARAAAIEIAGADATRLLDAWQRSAADGLDDARLRSVAQDLVSLARSRVQPIAGRWPGWLPHDAAAALSKFAESVTTTAVAAT